MKYGGYIALEYNENIFEILPSTTFLSVFCIHLVSPKTEIKHENSDTEEFH